VLAEGVPPMEPREAGLGRARASGCSTSRAAGARVEAVLVAGAVGGRSLGGALAGALLCVVVLRLQPGWVGLEPAADGLPASYVGLLLDGASGKPTVLASSRRHGPPAERQAAAAAGRAGRGAWRNSGRLPRGWVGAPLAVGVVALAALKPGSSVDGGRCRRARRRCSSRSTGWR
jgi:hypothetical protein